MPRNSIPTTFAVSNCAAEETLRGLPPGTLAPTFLPDEAFVGPPVTVTPHRPALTPAERLADYEAEMHGADPDVWEPVDLWRAVCLSFTERTHFGLSIRDLCWLGGWLIALGALVMACVAGGRP